MIATLRETGGETLRGAVADTWVSSCVSTLPWVAAPLDVMRRRKGARMMEEGTLSIVRRGQGYQVRYASNNPHGRDRLPHECPDEAHLTALLHQCGTESASITRICADVRQGRMAVLLVVVSAEQLQTFCDIVLPPVAAVLMQDSTGILH